jgi:hypothetical protein
MDVLAVGIYGYNKNSIFVLLISRFKRLSILRLIEYHTARISAFNRHLLKCSPITTHGCSHQAHKTPYIATAPSPPQFF